MLFFPGYALIAALFPKKSSLDVIERLALSFGLSIAAVPLIGLVLNYTTWGIRLYPVLISVTIFVFITSVVAWYRRQRLAQAERFIVSFNLSLTIWKGQRSVDRILSIILMAAILGAVGTISYVIATPKVGEKFTEFYVLGLEGKATDYPNEMKVGEEGRVIVGIINHEYEIVNYRVEVRINGAKNSEVGPIVLKHDEMWESGVSFTPEVAGMKQKAEFLLYKEGQSEAYQSLHLWLKVKE